MKDNKKKSVQNIHSTLRALCSHANKDGYDVELGSFMTVNYRHYITKREDLNDRQIIAMNERQIKEFKTLNLANLCLPSRERHDSDYKRELMHDLCVFSILTLMSPCDIIVLKRSSIQKLHDKGDCILYMRRKLVSKTDKKACVRITPEIQYLLEKYRSVSVGDYVFPIMNDEKHSIEQQMILTNGKVNRFLRVVQTHMGFPFALTWYCMRRTGISFLVNNGIPVELVAEIAGNTPQVIYKHYLKVGNSAMEDQLKKVYTMMQ